MTCYVYNLWMEHFLFSNKKTLLLPVFFLTICCPLPLVTPKMLIPSSCPPLLGAIESYRYQILAIARDDEDKKPELLNVNSQAGGRRITPDWNIVLGENVTDLNVVMLDSKTEVVVVVGERNLFVIEVDGSNCRFSLRFDFCPTSMHSFSCNGSLIILIASGI